MKKVKLLLEIFIKTFKKKLFNDLYTSWNNKLGQTYKNKEFITELTFPSNTKYFSQKEIDFYYKLRNNQLNTRARINCKYNYFIKNNNWPIYLKNYKKKQNYIKKYKDNTCVLCSN